MNQLPRLCIAALAFLWGCTESNQPLVPSVVPVPVSSLQNTTLKVTAPVPQSPTNDVKVARTPVTLTATPATGVYQSIEGIQFLYRFQLFGPTGTLVQDSGTLIPSFTVSMAMDDSARHTWRVRAESGPFTGPWSTTASFLAPNPRPCGPPNFFDPLSIIICHVDEYTRQYGSLHGSAELFLLDVAIDFNRAGVPGGPFGRLIKTTGENCAGYSCDIICAGQGGGQRQYDILLDGRIPIWGGSIDNPTVRECEIP